MPTYRYVVKLKNGDTRIFRSDKQLSKEQAVSVAKQATSAGEYQIKLPKSGTQTSTWEPSEKDLGGEKFKLSDLVKEPINIARDAIGGAEFLAGAATYLPSAPILGEQNFIARTGQRLMQAGKNTMSPEARAAWVENPRESAPALAHGVRQGMRAASYVMPVEGAGEAAAAGAINAMSNARDAGDALKKGAGGAASGALFSKLISGLGGAGRRLFPSKADEIPRTMSKTDVLATRLLTGDVVSSNELKRADKFLGADRIAKVMREFGIKPDVMDKEVAEQLFANEASRHRRLLDESGARATVGEAVANVVGAIKDRLIGGGTAHDRRAAREYAKSLLSQLRLVGGVEPKWLREVEKALQYVIENENLSGQEVAHNLDNLASVVQQVGGSEIPLSTLYDIAQANRKNFTNLLNSHNEVGATTAHNAYIDMLKMINDKLEQAGRHDVAEHSKDVAALGMVASGLGKKYAQTLGRYVGAKNVMQVSSLPIQTASKAVLNPTSRMLFSKLLSRDVPMLRNVTNPIKGVFIPQSHKLFRRR